MSQLPILVSASKLAKSPSNVRKSTDPVADAQLEANIAERGIIQNLVAVPVVRKKGHYRITAGGRRLDCVHRLIEKGIFATDYQVPVLILADARDAIEISLSENFFRLAMNPAEACRAFQDIIETESKSPADVAKRFGLTERFVMGRLRLASLAEPIFDALASGEITLDIAMAYASTSDAERQAVVFEQMSGNYYGNNVGEIRRQLASYSYRANDPRALLVGREAYVEAGGRIDRDLFSDADTETWLDTQIVDQLAEARLAAAAAEIRARNGFAEVRVVPATHVPYTQTYDLQPLRGELPALTVAEEARQNELEELISDIEKNAGGEEMNEEDEGRLRALESELSAITDRLPILTDEQRSQAVAYVVIGRDGVPRVHDQLYIAPLTDDQEDDICDRGNESADGGEAVNGKGAISQRLADELATMKTELLAIHVANDPAFALDLGTFIMAEAACQVMGTASVPSDLRANVPTPRVTGFDSETDAATQWRSLGEGLDRSWLECGTIEQRYDAFCGLADERRAAWLGWAVARTLHAVPVGKTGSGLIDHLGAKLEIDVAAWWRPTARNYFDRITKPRILDLFADIGGAELRSRYGSSKKHDLAVSAERLFAGDIMVEADMKDRALRWLPSEMRFAAEPDMAIGEANVAEENPETGANDAPSGSERCGVTEAGDETLAAAA